MTSWRVVLALIVAVPITAAAQERDGDQERSAIWRIPPIFDRGSQDDQQGEWEKDRSEAEREARKDREEALREREKDRREAAREVEKARRERARERDKARNERLRERDKERG